MYPRDGPVEGGVPVAIKGVGFLNNQPAGVQIDCQFGSQIVPGHVVDANILACVTPAAAPGRVSVNILSSGKSLTPPVC